MVEIKTDKRFGTPVFKTIGGASKCPAEPGTIWMEESGMIIEIASSPGVNNMAVLPNSLLYLTSRLRTNRLTVKRKFTVCS